MEARRGGAQRVRRPVRARSATTRSWPRSASSPAHDGVFVEPASAAGIAGLLAGARGGGVLRRAHGRRSPSPATGSRTPRPRSRASPRPATHRRHGRGRRRRPPPRRRPGSPEAARPHGDLRRRRRCGSPCPPPPPTSGRASTPSGWRSTCATSSRPRSSTDGLAVEVAGAGADAVPRDESHLVVRAMRAAFAEMGAAAARPAARLPQRHPARPRPGLVVGRDRRGRLPGPRRWSPAARC